MKLTLEIHDVTLRLDDGDGIWVELPGHDPIRLPMTDEGAAAFIRRAEIIAGIASGPVSPREFD